MLNKTCSNCGQKTETVKVICQNKEYTFCDESCLYDFLKNCKGRIE